MEKSLNVIVRYRLMHQILSKDKTLNKNNVSVGGGFVGLIWLQNNDLES